VRARAKKGLALLLISIGQFIQFLVQFDWDAKLNSDCSIPGRVWLVIEHSRILFPSNAKAGVAFVVPRKAGGALAFRVRPWRLHIRNCARRTAVEDKPDRPRSWLGPTLGR
jgi:hypothetical protein